MKAPLPPVDHRYGPFYPVDTCQGRTEDSHIQRRLDHWTNWIRPLLVYPLTCNGTKII